MVDSVVKYRQRNIVNIDYPLTQFQDIMYAIVVISISGWNIDGIDI